AVAGAGQVNLGDAFGGDTGEEWIERLRELAAPVGVQELGIGDQDAGPAPDPVVAERELTGGLNGAAECSGGRAVGAVAGGEIAGVLLKNAGRLDRIGAIHQAM